MFEVASRIGWLPRRRMTASYSQMGENQPSSVHSEKVLLVKSQINNTKFSDLPSPVSSSVLPYSDRKMNMELMWCDTTSICMGEDNLREMVIQSDQDSATSNKIVMRGPATGQVAYHWVEEEEREIAFPYSKRVYNDPTSLENNQKTKLQHCVLFLIKHGSDMNDLLNIAADAIQRLLSQHENLHILLDSDTDPLIRQILVSSNNATTDSAENDQLSKIHILETKICRGFGENVPPIDIASTEFGASAMYNSYGSTLDDVIEPTKYAPNMIVTLGGDGLLMHAALLFQGPMPPILCVAGGSLGFLTPFAPSEMVEAIEISLGLNSSTAPLLDELPKKQGNALQVFPPNMAGYDENDYYINGHRDSMQDKFAVGLGDCICLSIRMRLDCRIINPDGVVKARYNVLNEVVIDRGSSPYLAALECFCDDVHLTTVQADGIIFATPTGSTAYSLSAGSSVVHPAVPCILVTPICPHVLSFRSMVFPDHVILRCYVPHDARAEASVAFDGKHRQELHRGDSVQIRLSAYPVPTINRQDHSADWLGSLKRNFNFNSRPRQRPL
jgi:NAD+ kinase